MIAVRTLYVKRKYEMIGVEKAPPVTLYPEAKRRVRC